MRWYEFTDTIVTLIKFFVTLIFIGILVCIALGFLEYMGNLYILIPILLVIYFIIHIDWLYYYIKRLFK
jgi:hypothetical protein